MKRSQTSIEFIFAIGMVLLIFLFIMGVAFNKSIDVNRIKRTIETKDTCTKFSSAIMNAFLHGNGTRINLKLDYNATTFPNSRLVSVDDDYVTCSIPIDQYSEISLTKPCLFST